MIARLGTIVLIGAQRILGNACSSPVLAVGVGILSLGLTSAPGPRPSVTEFLGRGTEPQGSRESSLVKIRALGLGESGTGGGRRLCDFPSPKTPLLQSLTDSGSARGIPEPPAVGLAGSGKGR